MCCCCCCWCSLQTGTAAGGPQEVSAGWEVPSSDTDLALDPAEGKKYTQRETQGSTPVPSGGSGSSSQSMSQQSSGSGQTGQTGQTQGRDESDRQMGGEGSGGGKDTRTHPVARTAATAIGSAAGEDQLQGVNLQSRLRLKLLFGSLRMVCVFTLQELPCIKDVFCTCEHLCMVSLSVYPMRVHAVFDVPTT
jgi:hypothetical protein